MTLGLLFWILMVFWFVFGAWSGVPEIRGGAWRPSAGSLIVFVVVFLLGWRVFGFIVQG